MATLDKRTEPLSVSYHRIVRPPAPQQDEPATFSLRSLFATTTAFAVYLGLINRYPWAILPLSTLLCFLLAFVYFTRHYRMCIGRAMVRAVALGTLSGGVIPILLSFVGRPLDPGLVVFNCYVAFFVCGSAAFAVAVGTVLFEACIGR